MSGVTVIVPTYNRARYIGECLDSVLGQTHAPSQVIVVDDGSSDATPEILAAYGTRIEVLRQANAGKAVALNRALPRVRGEFVWMFDDDDVALPESIAVRLLPMTAAAGIEFVYSAHYAGSNGPDDRIVRGERYHLPALAGRRVLTELTRGCFLTQQGVLARTSCFERIGPVNESFARGQDYELLLRLARSCRGQGIDEPTFVFRRHDGVRGPAQATHASSSRDAVWMQFEHRIGQWLRAELPLEAFVASDEPPEITDAPVRRLALLGRAASMASKGLVDEMADDIVDAAEIAPPLALQGECAALCAGAITREFAQVALRGGGAAFLRRVSPLRRHRAGRSALRCLARGAFWVARHPDPERMTRVEALGLALRLARLGWA